MKTCNIEDCEKPRKARGWCGAHWQRWRKHGDPLGSAPLPEKKSCSIEDCEKPTLARSWCSTHYQRWREHGDPLGGGERYATPEEAFLARTEPLLWSGCVVWTGALDGSGYGRLQVNGRMVSAHRYAWERERGPIPDGMYVDHICYVRSCVNTEHLRLATPQENQQNRSGAWKGRMHDLPRGVYLNGCGYGARIRHNGTLHHLGTFSTPEEASAVAQAERAIRFGEFAGGA